MEKVGVMAVVEGLSSFVGDINKMNSSMKSLMPQGNALTGLFGVVTNALSSFGREILNVAEYALGHLLADAIEFVIGKFKELVTETIKAGAEFQSLSLRLTRLNFNTAIEQTGEYNSAMALATKTTKEQLTWIQKLAVQTPYDAQDIANVFTLARSYGFASDEAKGLTEDISNFAAGMGLGNTEIERIIVNFGQMAQQGKVAGRELTDLARGAFVPVNDILKIMQEETGLTGAAFDDFRNSGEGVTAFMKAFTTLVETRFQGSAEQMARTFEGATANAKDFVKSLIGFNVVKPILDSVGGKIADMMGALTEPEAWDRLNRAAALVGFAFTDLVNDILGLAPSVDGFVDKIVAGLGKIASWVIINKGKIVGFFKAIVDGIKNDVVPFIRDVLIPAFMRFADWFVQNKPKILQFFRDLGQRIQRDIKPFIDKLVESFDKIKKWVSDNGALIKKFFKTLGQIVENVFGQLGGDLDTGGVDGFLDKVSEFMQFVVDNQQGIADFVTNLTKLWAVFTVLGFVLGVVMGALVAIATPLLAVIGFIGGLVAVITVLFSPIGLLIALIALLAYELLLNWQNVVVGFEFIKAYIATWWTELWANFILGVTYIKDIIAQWWMELWSNFEIGAVALGDTFLQMWENFKAYVSEGTTATLEMITTWITNLMNGLTVFKDNAILKFLELKNGIIAKIVELLAVVKAKVDIMKRSWEEVKWYTVGERIITGITAGVVAAAKRLVQAVIDAVVAAYNAAMNTAQAHSPSKLFMDIGEFMMMGMEKGIDTFAAKAVNAMEEAVSAVAAPAMNLPAITQQYSAAASPTVNNQNNYTSNYNLTVNSGAATEPIIQDYNMMKSLAQR